MRILARVALVTGAMTQAIPAAAQEDAWKAPPPPWEGTWQGTIGELPVHVCLNNTPYENQGAYYYDVHRALIRLDLDDAGLWVERTGRDDRGSRWDLTETAADLLDGTWTDGKKNLPVHLRRIGGPSQDYEGPCATMQFQKPRVGTVGLKSANGTKDGTRFTTWSFKPGPPFKSVEISTFTLDRPGAAIAKVNAKLREILPKPDGTGAWLDCMAANTNAHGSDGAYWESVEPTEISTRWLGLNHHEDSYCGGNHPNTTNRSRVFDLTTGVEVDPHDWFKPSAVHVEHYEPGDEPAKMLTDRFRTFLVRGWKAQDRECLDSVREEEFWDIGIARGALVFSPQLPRVVMACGEDIKVPFTRIQPWLNEKGKAAVATLPR